MSEQIQLTTEQEKQLQDLKVVLNALASIHHKMQYRISCFAEEFQQHMIDIGVLMSFHQDVQKKVYELEPPVEQEKKEQKPYVMDLTHVKGESVESVHG